MSIWDFWASKYERLWVQKYSLGPTRKAVLKEIKDILYYKRDKNSLSEESNGIQLLDVGCGTGQLTREISEKFKGTISYVEGVDYSKAMVEEAMRSSTQINYINSPIENYNTTRKFSIITCTHSFPYYKDKKGTIEKFYNLLEKEGYVLLAQASERSFYDKIAMFIVKFTTTKARYLSPKEIKEITKEHFVLEEEILIREKPYMPSIVLFRMRRK